MEKNIQKNKLYEIFILRGFKSVDNFKDYKDTRSYISYYCDKGHICNTQARNILYGNSGCKTCQYNNRRTLINVDLKDTDFKVCNICGEKKNRSLYGVIKKNEDGLRSTCKLCRRKKTILDSLDIKIKRNEKSLKYFREKPFRVLLSRCKSNHRKKGMIGFNLTEDFLHNLYIKQNGKCYWSDINMPLDNIGLGELNSISIDRLDSSKGYLQDNVVLSCKFYNLGRGMSSSEYFINFLIINKLKISKDLQFT